MGNCAYNTCWGFDIFTGDSSACSAAILMGTIIKENGGLIKVRMLPGQKSYATGSAQGFTSSTYGSYSDSFEVSRGSNQPEWEPWADFGECSKTCGNGEQV